LLGASGAALDTAMDRRITGPNSTGIRVLGEGIWANWGAKDSRSGVENRETREQHSVFTFDIQPSGFAVTGHRCQNMVRYATRQKLQTWEGVIIINFCVGAWQENAENGRLSPRALKTEMAIARWEQRPYYSSVKGGHVLIPNAAPPTKNWSCSWFDSNFFQICICS